MGRAPCCDKGSVKKGPWSPEEDAKLKSYIDQNGTGGNWIALPQKIGLKRCGKSCRLRWLNYLRPNIRHGGFSQEEDNIICSLYITIGSRWSIIAAQLPGRTDNDIKNYWNTRLKKKLLGKHRKEKRGRGREKSTNPNSTAPILYNSNEDPRFNDYASITRFSTQDHVQINSYEPPIDEALIQPLYNPIDQLPMPQFDMVGSTDHISAVLPASTVDLADFERVTHDNSQRLQGLDFFFDEFINSAGTSMEMNSSIFAANSSQGFLQGPMMQEEFGVDKMRYGGIQ